MQLRSPFTTMVSTLLKYHQQQNQPNSILPTLLSPLSGLKPLQINQNFRQQTSSCFHSQKCNSDLTQPISTAVISATLGSTDLSNSTRQQQHLKKLPDGNSSTGNIGNGKRKRSWSRAVFSNLQRKGLEIQFQQQKYITKPDRRKLAARLNLTDAQVNLHFF